MLLQITAALSNYYKLRQLLVLLQITATHYYRYYKLRRYYKLHRNRNEKHFSEAHTEMCFSDLCSTDSIKNDLKISSKELIFQRKSNKRHAGTFRGFASQL